MCVATELADAAPELFSFMEPNPLSEASPARSELTI